MWGGLVVAVAVSLGAGLYAGNTLDMARVLGLLPFFVMGLKATPERLELLRRKPAQVAAVCVLLALWVVTTWTDVWASTEWLYYRSRYDEMGYGDDVRALLTRALVLALGTLGAWAFLALVPRLHGWFTRMGAWTLVVYLFHGFVVKAASYADYGGWAASHAVISFGVTTIAAVLLALFLAWQPVAGRLNNVVDPLGYGERHLKDAVDLTAAKDQVQPEVQAEVEAGVGAGLHAPVQERTRTR
jgi:fucose 4-O-acetylase-like acetyltransferase